jgi:hypothetical protein
MTAINSKRNMSQTVRGEVPARMLYPEREIKRTSKPTVDCAELSARLYLDWLTTLCIVASIFGPHRTREYLNRFMLPFFYEIGPEFDRLCLQTRAINSE